jgi:type I restriction enzyme S subunit
MSAPLPKGWTLATLSNLISSGGLFTDGDWVESKDQDPAGEVRLIQLADVGDGAFRNRSSRFLRPDQAERLGCTFLQEGDVLVARMPDPLGRACIYPGSKLPAVTAVDVCIIRPSNDEIDNRWLMWFLNAPQFRREVSARQTGTTRKRISRSNLAALPLPVPTFAEQNHIVAAIEEHFSHLEAGLAGLERAKRKLHGLRMSALQAALEPSARDRNWPQFRLADVAEVQLGRQRSPKNHTGPNMLPYLRAANVTWAGVDLSDVKTMNFSPSELHTFRLEPGDLLLAEASGSASEVGKPAIWRGEMENCCFQNTLLRVRSKGPLPEFLLLVFRHAALTGRFGSAARGVGIHHLGAHALSDWLVHIPPPNEQQAIVEAAARTMSLIDALENMLGSGVTRVQTLRRAVLAAAFRGELIGADEPTRADKDMPSRSRRPWESALDRLTDSVEGAT